MNKTRTLSILILTLMLIGIVQVNALVPPLKEKPSSVNSAADSAGAGFMCNAWTWINEDMWVTLEPDSGLFVPAGNRVYFSDNSKINFVAIGNYILLKWLYFAPGQGGDVNGEKYSQIDTWYSTPIQESVYVYKDSQVYMPCKTTPKPHVANVSKITSNSAEISWKTSNPSDTSVIHSIMSGNYSAAHIVNTTMTTDHKEILVGLNPNTKYYFIAESWNEYGQLEFQSEEQTFTTLPAGTGYTKVSMNTDKTIYTWGQNIIFTVKNIGTIPVYLNCPYITIQNSLSKEEYSSVCAMVVEEPDEILPGLSRTYNYNTASLPHKLASYKGYTFPGKNVSNSFVVN